MRVTLTDVAKAAGTSASTVSRALSSPEKVNAETGERLRQLAEEMGYVPMRTSRTSDVQRHEVIGLIVPDIANPFFPPIIKAVQARAAMFGQLAAIHDIDEYAADEGRHVKMLVDRVDGLILASPRSDESFLTDLSSQLPVVLINREIEGISSVSVENAIGVHEAVEHLVSLGHRRISYLAGPRRSWSNAQRVIAVREATDRLGVDLLELGPFEPDVRAGVQAADLVMSTGATGVLAYDDVIAVGLMARLRERGVDIGPEISVIGIDGSPLSETSFPPLSTVFVPGAQAGQQAVDLLLDLVEANAKGRALAPLQRSISVETRLIIRGSTAPLTSR